MRRLSKYTLFAALLVLAVLPLSGSAATTRAHVASHSAKAAFCSPWNLYCHTWVPAGTTVRGCANPQCGGVYESQNTRVQMICWFDNGYARWFYVQEWSAGSWGFVESWKVYNEIPTPHC